MGRWRVLIAYGIETVKQRVDYVRETTSMPNLVKTHSLEISGHKWVE